MEEKYHFSSTEEKKLEQLYTATSKTEPNHMRFSELVLLILEKGLMRNTFGLRTYLEIYHKYLELDLVQEKKPEVVDPRKKQQEQVKEVVIGKLTKYKFQQMLVEISKLYYPGYKKPTEKYIQEILVEVTPQNLRRKNSGKNTPQHRVIVYDELCKKLLNESSIQAILEYENDLRKLFTAYMGENLEKQQIMLTWEEIDILNKKMPSICMIKLLYESNIYPQHFTIDSYTDVSQRILPPITSQENAFYSQEQIKKMAERELGKRQVTQKFDGDPKINFFEFKMILGRIALDSSPKDQLKKEKDFYDCIKKYFTNVLQIRENTQDNDWDSLNKINKTSTNYLYRLYCKKKEETNNNNQADNNNTQSQKNIPKNKNSTDLLQIEKEEGDKKGSKIQQLAEKNYKFGENITPKYDIDFIIKNMDNELLPAPAQYMPEGIDGKNSKLPPKVIGEQPPKPPVDKNAKKPQDKKGNDKKKKKGEAEEREIRWAGEPQPFPKKTYDYFQELNDNLEFRNALEIAKRSGTMSHIEPLPIILEEMIYPLNIPPESQKFLEAAILNQAQSNFECALENINTCYDLWLNIEQRNELIIVNEIFFDYFKGSIFLSAGRDDLALSSFYSSKYPSDKLSIDSPDKALPYCGLGATFFRMEEYSLALRCFLKAREIREAAIGGDNMESATVYNNIGCCMMKLDRNLEAATYFELAYAIFDLEIGQFHIRTSTVARNLQKCKKQGIGYLPEFKTSWITYEQDIFGKKKPVKKKAKK